MTLIKVVDYGAGNLRSVLNSLRKISAPDEEIELCADADALLRADRVILPGVGAYEACRAGIDAIDGMKAALDDYVRSGRPLLGICVGMQLLVESGEEHGITTEGFGWISGHVRMIKPQNPQAKIPHMGWNDLLIDQPHPVLAGLEAQSDVYFVHSYAAEDVPRAHLIAHTDYFGAITAAIAKENVFGTQFHPEKSQKNGLRILRNFLDWQPV